jgi:hypothetical protein
LENIKTKKAAVTTALEEYIHRYKQLLNPDLVSFAAPQSHGFISGRAATLQKIFMPCTAITWDFGIDPS